MLMKILIAMAIPITLFVGVNYFVPEIHIGTGVILGVVFAVMAWRANAKDLSRS